MIVNEAMEEFRKIVTSHPVNLCECDTCDGWFPKVRHLFTEVRDTAYSLGWHEAFHPTILLGGEE